MSQFYFADAITAGAYERLLMPRIFEPWGRVLLDRAELFAGARVLDVATGPGTIARMVAERVGREGRVDGVDISAQMLAEASAKAPVPGQAAIEYAQGSADALPFAAESFDVVTCQQGVQFFPDQLAALREMRRVLRPGGCVTLAMWADDAAMTLFAAFRRAFAAVHSTPARGPLGWLDVGQLSVLLVQAGFVAPQVEEVSLAAKFEQGLSQVLASVDGTTVGPGVRAMTPSERRAFEERVAEELAPYVKDGGVEAPARALVASAGA